MAEFNGGNVVFVPMPTAPEMVMWALPGPAGDIPYADVEALVDAEFDDRIATMTQLESDTEAHATTASQAATAADASALAAAGSATAASGSASDAATSASAAESSATGADTARSGAEAARDVADSHADRAELAADSFGLTATATTGAEGSNATVTVIGEGPAYGLSFTVPRGDKGPKGDDGEVSQAALDAAVASLVDNAPEALDTLTELAAALGNDPNFATTVSTEIGKRALIDGAPAAYNTLGKLVTALQNHELGGSTDASLLTGALTAQVDASAAIVHSSHTGMGGAFEMPISELAYGLVDMSAYIAGKSDVGHTHDGADISGALTAQVNVGEALFAPTGDVMEHMTILEFVQAMISEFGNYSRTNHKHPVGDLTTTGTASSSTYLRGDGTWATPTNTTYSVPPQAEAEAGTATTARAFSAQRVRQAANAAISAREWTGTQAQYDALGTKDPQTTYYVTE